jgi:hypothetical protein
MSSVSNRGEANFVDEQKNTSAKAKEQIPIKTRRTGLCC